jgi:hypothetical protein
MLGHKHSLESRIKRSENLRGENHSMFGKTHSEESKLKMSMAKGITIYLYSLDLNLIQTFPSIKAAVQHFGSNSPSATARGACAPEHSRTITLKRSESDEIFRDISKTHTMYVLLTYIYTSKNTCSCLVVF